MIIDDMDIHIDPRISDIDFVKRSWRERLFSWPWRPFKKMKSVYAARVYEFWKKDPVRISYIVSPATYEKLKEGTLKI